MTHLDVWTRCLSRMAERFYQHVMLFHQRQCHIVNAEQNNRRNTDPRVLIIWYSFIYLLFCWIMAATIRFRIFRFRRVDIYIEFGGGNLVLRLRRTAECRNTNDAHFVADKRRQWRRKGNNKIVFWLTEGCESQQAYRARWHTHTYTHKANIACMRRSETSIAVGIRKIKALIRINVYRISKWFSCSLIRRCRPNQPARSAPNFSFRRKTAIANRHWPSGTARAKASAQPGTPTITREKEKETRMFDCRPSVHTWLVRAVNVMISTWFHIKQHAGNGLAWFKYKINSITYTSNDTAENGQKKKSEIVETKLELMTADALVAQYMSYLFGAETAGHTMSGQHFSAPNGGRTQQMECKCYFLAALQRAFN